MHVIFVLSFFSKFFFFILVCFVIVTFFIFPHFSQSHKKHLTNYKFSFGVKLEFVNPESGAFWSKGPGNSTNSNLKKKEKKKKEENK